MKTEKYEHHGKEVSANAEFKGKHRDICLCYACAKFGPEGAHTCPIAAAVFANCMIHSLVTPVLECPEFEA